VIDFDGVLQPIRAISAVGPQVEVQHLHVFRALPICCDKHLSFDVT